MVQARIPIPLVVGGVSSQEPEYRQATQVGDARNVMYSLTGGAYKRSPIEAVYEIGKYTTANIAADGVTLTKTGAFANYGYEAGDKIWLIGGTNVTVGEYTIASRTSDDVVVLSSDCTTDSSSHADVSFIDPTLTRAGADVRMHLINRDSSEQYVVVYGESLVMVYDLSGTKATVTNSGGLAYINLNDATCDDLRLATAIDTTIIVNRTVTPLLEDSSPYHVTQDHTDYDVLTSYVPLSGEYHYAEGDTVAYPAGYWRYTSIFSVAGVTFPTWLGVRFDDVSVNWRTLSNWQTTGRNPQGMCLGYTWNTLADTNLTFDHSALTLTKASAFATYTWASGDMLHVTDGTNVVKGWYTIVSRDSDDQITLDSDITVAGTDPADVDFDGIGKGGDVHWDFEKTPPDDFEAAALAIQRVIRNTLHQDFCVRYVDDPANRQRMKITGPWFGTDCELWINPPMENQNSVDSVIYDMTVTGADFRPFSTGTFTAGTGTSDYTNYPVADRWTRVAAPNQTNALVDEGTLPVRLTRTATSPLAFTLIEASWKDRTSGNNDTNPPVKLLEEGAAIQDITFYRNRLVLAGDQYIAMSQAGDLFNLWIDNFDNVGDADPVDYTLSTNEVAIIDSVFPWRGLQIFTKADLQFSDNDPTTITPESIAIRQTNAYPTLVGVEPIVNGNVCYFCAEYDGICQLYEMFYDDASAAPRAIDVSSHVDRWLSGDVERIAGCSHLNSVFILASGTDFLTADDAATGAIYVYQPAYKNNERIMSSWSRLDCWSDADGELNDILDCGVLGDYMYLLNRYDNTAEFATQSPRMWLCRMLVGENRDDDVFLDHREEVTITSNSVLTYFPYSTDCRPDCVVLTTVVGYENTVFKLSDYTEGAEGDYVFTSSNLVFKTTSLDISATLLNAKKAYVGRIINTDIELTRPVFRDQDGVPSLDAAVIVRKLTIKYEDSSNFNVTITQPGRTDRTLSAGLAETGRASGQFDVYIRGDSKDAEVHITSDSPGPLRILGGEWLCDIVGRSRA